jgi:hypothetical protein
VCRALGLVLNILLLLFSATATFAAFGGKTWRDGPEPLAKRVTRRGWLSLICLALALQVGIAREVRSDRQGETLTRERDQANQRLRTANTKLNGLRHELRSTREDLSNQSRINLITTLSAGHPIKEVAWRFRFNSRAAPAANLIEYLASSLPPAYRSVARIELNFSMPGVAGSYIELTFDGDVVVTAHPLPNNPIDSTLILPGFLTNRRPDPLRERSSFVVLQQTGMTARPNASVVFNGLDAREEIGTITLRMARIFRTVEESRQFIADNPHLRAKETFDTDRGIEVAFEIPDGIANAFSAYWRSAFNFSIVTAYLDDAASLTISSPVELRNFANFENSSITARFYPAGEPEISVDGRSTRRTHD